MIILITSYYVPSVLTASDENTLTVEPRISLPHDADGTNQPVNREKRQGGGGFIPFRPLFVYRQQQREMQERWKEIEARKKLREQQQLYPQTIQSPQFYQSNNSPRPPSSSTSSITYNYPTAYQQSYQPSPYSAYSAYLASYYKKYYPSWYYSTYYPSYSSSYYPSYYDGYDYSYF